MPIKNPVTKQRIEKNTQSKKCSLKILYLVLACLVLYERASIALANSLDFRKAILNNGTTKEIIDFNLSLIAPFLKSTPLDDWAFKILWDSDNNDGTNLKAIAIIIDASTTGNLKIFSGLKISSSA